MSTATQETTAEQLLKMPDDGFRYELVRGELRKIAPAGDEHGKIARWLGGWLSQHVEADSLGRVLAAEPGFRLSVNPDTVRAPMSLSSRANAPNG